MRYQLRSQSGQHLKAHWIRWSHISAFVDAGTKNSDMQNSDMQPLTEICEVELNIAFVHWAGRIHPREQVAAAAILEHDDVTGVLAPDKVRLHHEAGATARGALVGSPLVEIVHPYGTPYFVLPDSRIAQIGLLHRTELERSSVGELEVSRVGELDGSRVGELDEFHLGEGARAQSLEVANVEFADLSEAVAYKE